MIVVDANVIMYAVVRGPMSQLADQVAGRDNDWRAPRLWRSEILSALAGYFRGGLSRDEALLAFLDAEDLITQEIDTDPGRVFRLLSVSKCSA